MQQVHSLGAISGRIRCYLKLRPPSWWHMKETGCSSPSPFLARLFPPGSMPLNLCHSGGKQPTSAHTCSGFGRCVSGPPGASSAVRVPEAALTSTAELQVSVNTLLLPLNDTTVYFLPCSEARYGAPFFLWPPFLSSHPSQVYHPLRNSATQGADSPLDGIAEDGAAPGVAGRGPGQDEAVSVHIQASDIQWGTWGPQLLGCSI